MLLRRWRRVCFGAFAASVLGCATSESNEGFTDVGEVDPRDLGASDVTPGEGGGVGDAAGDGKGKGEGDVGDATTDKDVSSDVAIEPSASCGTPATRVGATLTPPVGSDSIKCPWPDFSTMAMPSLPVAPASHTICRGAWAAPAEPVFPAKKCTVDVAKWKIATGCTNAEETSSRLQQAITAASAEGCGHVVVPAGCYLVGRKVSGAYSEGISIPSNMSLELDPSAKIQLAPMTTWNSCTIAIRKSKNVGLSGGTIIGDRKTHIYSKPPAGPSPTQGDGLGDDEGNVLCVDQTSERVLIQGVTVRDATGDGLLIVADTVVAGTSCVDVTVRKSQFLSSRRNGISVVGGLRILIEDNDIVDTHGTAPQFGIDIESTFVGSDPKYVDRDIVIRRNRFFENFGGDFVNYTGTNVLFENNQMNNGCLPKMIDGQVILWKRTDATVRLNKILNTASSYNGRCVILGYAVAASKQSPSNTLVYGNAVTGGNLYFYDRTNLEVGLNNFVEGFIDFKNVTALQLFDNNVKHSKPNTGYHFKDTSGAAGRNLLNGVLFDIPLKADSLYTKWPL